MRGIVQSFSWVYRKQRWVYSEHLNNLFIYPYWMYGYWADKVYCRCVQYCNVVFSMRRNNYPADYQAIYTERQMVSDPWAGHWTSESTEFSVTASLFHVTIEWCKTNLLRTRSTMKKYLNSLYIQGVTKNIETLKFLIDFLKRTKDSIIQKSIN